MHAFKFSPLLVIILLVSACNTGNKKEKKGATTGQEIVRNIPSPSGTGSSLPFLFTDGSNAILSWVEAVNDTTHRLKYAELVEDAWQQPKEIITGKDWFVNWADFPMITANNGNLLSHVLRKSSPGTYSYDIKLNVLPAGDSVWSTSLPLHTDGTETEHGFVTALPYKENSFFVTWLDGRNTSSAGHGEGHAGAMSLRAAEVSAKGWVGNEVLLDDRTCDCCQTTAAITSNGPVVLYRDRTEDEVRDISITRRVNGKWTAPRSINEDGWEIKGCPVNGPKAAAIGNTLGVSWFTAANNQPKVNLIFSHDGGENFDTPIVISEKAPLGRVDLLMIDEEYAIVSWMEATDTDARLLAMKVHATGKKYNAIVVDSLSASRRSGLPQMGLVKDKVHFAWTNISEKETSIKTAYINLNNF
ncbi:hypothetical protein [Arenibacter amylolyticus]|uniref:hypothetical protein n=1 Tax=Arenibacter amylolyticus TaxID=1406873 RepID=UPI000A39F635|nr:hypothetical protein [Arenibacter amylolyticus]